MFSAKIPKQDFSNNSSNNNKNDYLKQFHAHVTLSIKQKHVMLFIPNKTLKMLVGFLAQKLKKQKQYWQNMFHPIIMGPFCPTLYPKT